jgi:pimeloyl-ACP methyl ester carboxylesterase
MSRRHTRPAPWVVLALLVTLASCTSSQAPPTAPPPSGSAGDFAQSVDIGNGRTLFLECHGTNAAGNETVVLISGYRDSGDVWTVDEAIVPPSVGPAVPVGLARSHRVCSFDRPGTLRYTADGNPLTDRSSPVPQPRTAADVVADLHAVLSAAQVPGPYIVTAHSLGGLFARLYAQTYPVDVGGIVFVDAFSATVPEVFGARWPLYRDDVLGAVPPGTQLSVPTAERIDIDATVAQVNAAPPLRPVPIAVLTKTEPFETSLPFPPELPSADLNRLYEVAQTSLVALEPGTPQTFATGDAHYIQWQSPDLVIATTNMVNGRAVHTPDQPG